MRLVTRSVKINATALTAAVYFRNRIGIGISVPMSGSPFWRIERYFWFVSRPGFGWQIRVLWFLVGRQAKENLAPLDGIAPYRVCTTPTSTADPGAKETPCAP